MFLPGRLSRAFIAGRRVRHASPLQLYLAAATGFFLVQAYRPLVRLDPERLEVRAVLASVGAFRKLPDSLAAELAAAGISPEVFAARFDIAVSGYLPVLLLVLLATFALWLKLICRGRPFSLHATFSLHWSAFYLVLEGARRITPVPSGLGVPVAVAMSVLSVAYLAVAFREAYGSGAIASVAKALSSLVLYYVLVSLWLNSTVALAARLV